MASEDMPPRRYMVVLGGPGAGKGSVNKLLCAQHARIRHLSTGTLLRAFVDAYRESESREEVVATTERCMAEGELVPEEIMLSVLEEATRGEIRADGYFKLQLAIAGLVGFGSIWFAWVVALLVGWEPWTSCAMCAPDDDEPGWVWPLNALIAMSLIAGDLTTWNGVKKAIARKQDPRDDKTILLLDGFPRSKSQAEAMVSLLGGPPILSVYLEVSEAEMKKRVLGRGRADDTADVLATRIKSFLDETVPAVNYLEGLKGGMAERLDGDRAIDEVFADFAELYVEALAKDALDNLTKKPKKAVVNPMNNPMHGDDEDSEDDSDDEEALPAGHVQTTVRELRAMMETMDGDDAKVDKQKLQKRIDRMLAAELEAVGIGGGKSSAWRREAAGGAED